MIRRIAYCIGLILVASLLTEWLLYSQNSLVQNNQWVVAKRMSTLGLMGADEFLLDRSVLAKNRINLGKYYGFQEIYTKKKMIPKKIFFNFKIDNGSYLDFFIRLNQGAEIGFRLNNRSNRKSFTFVNPGEEKFAKKHFFESNLKFNSWNTAELIVNNSEITLQLNNNKPLDLNFDTPLSGNIGFRAGQRGAFIDDIFINGDKNFSYSETFRRTEHWPRIFLIHLLFTFILVELFQLLIKKYYKFKKADKKKDQRNFIVYQLCISLLIIFLFDYNFWSKKSFSPTSKILFANTPVPTHIFEKKRFFIFQEWARIFSLNQNPRKLIAESGYPIRRIFEGPILCSSNPVQCIDYSQERKIPITPDRSSCKKIIFMGTSQTIGAGASKLSDTFFARIHKSLIKNQKVSCLVSLNLAKSGSNLKEIINQYRNHFSDFDPDLMIINIAHNDRKQAIEKNLPILLELNQKLGTKSIILEEANSVVSDGKDDRLVNKHNLMKRIAAKYNVSTIPLHTKLQEIEAQELGVMWWDICHMTDYGQKVTADWLTKKIVESGIYN
jgi:lysophospholipase L1-like esterase